MTRLEVGEERAWTHRTKRCKVVKNEVGHWCGYTQTSLRGFMDTDLYDHGGHEAVRILSVHGGLTYGPDDNGWVGFDCGHARDLNLNEDDEPWGTSYEELGHEPMELSRRGSIEACEAAEDCFVWRLADVKTETEKLADQLIALENFISTLES